MGTNSNPDLKFLSLCKLRYFVYFKRKICLHIFKVCLFYVYSCMGKNLSVPQAENADFKKQVSMIKKNNNHMPQSNYGIVKKSHIMSTVTRHPRDKKSKSTSSLFLFKMIAKLERTQSNAQQNKTKTNTEPPPPQPMGSTPNNTDQQQNHRLRTDSSLTHRVLKYILLVSTLSDHILPCLLF